MLQALLKINRMQRWYSNLEDKFDGAPADGKKLWKQLRKDLIPALKRTAAPRVKIKNTGVKIKSTGVSLLVSGYKPVTPSKKLVITLTGMPASVRMTKCCIESAKQYGEDHNLEILTAVSKFESRDFFIRHNLTWYWEEKESDALAAMGCFASHFKLWLRCMDLGKPVIALEHDALFRASIPTLKFRHILMLGVSNETWRDKSQVFTACKKGITFYPNDHLLGTQAYAITPEGAHKLVKAAKENLLIPVDHFIRKKLVSILYCNPYPIKSDNSWGSSVCFRGGKENFAALWKSHEHSPVRDQSRSTRR